MNSPAIHALEKEYFTSDAIFSRVREEVFYRHWQFACHSSQIANSGDYHCLRLLGQDVAVIRDKDGTVRTFYNVCRHRGHTLLTGSGNKKAIRCPYHAWSYKLSGELIHAPGSEANACFDRTAIRLSEIRCEIFLGFIFINFDPDCPAMDVVYPGTRQEILTLCPDIEQRRFATQHHSDEKCNWMIAVENYNECYHCKHVHDAFAKGVIDPQSYRVTPNKVGRVLRHSSKPSTSGDAWYDTASSGSDYGSFFLWPATAIQIYPGGLLNTYHWRPLKVDDTRVYRSWFSESGRVGRQLQRVIDLDRDTTFAEDLKLVKAVQRGVRSRGYSPGPLIIDANNDTINNELSIAALHTWLRQDLAVDRGQ